MGTALGTLLCAFFSTGALAQDTEAAPAEAAADTKKESEQITSEEGINLTLQDRIKAVSRKTFIKEGRFELEPFGGISTNDAFFRRWTLGARVSYHLNDNFSLDFGGAGNVFSEQLDAVRFLRETQLAITDDAVLFGYADAGVTFSPIYGKFSLMSEWIIHFDAFVSGGIGAAFDSNVTPVHPAMEIGVGGRVFLNRWVVLRADLRDYIYPQDRSGISTLQNLLMLNLGVGFYFPLDFEYKYQAAKIVD